MTDQLTYAQKIEIMKTIFTTATSLSDKKKEYLEWIDLITREKDAPGEQSDGS